MKSEKGRSKGSRRASSSRTTASFGLESHLESDELLSAATAAFGKADSMIRGVFGWEESDDDRTPPADAESAPPPPPAAASSEPADLVPSVPALAISFAPSGQTTRSCLSEVRFGGQPDWLEEPLWPLSTQDGQPMEFVAQFAVHPTDFPWLDEPKVVYLFVSNDEYDPGGYETWDPFAGENALIVQPGATPDWVSCEPLISGPTARPIELSVGLEPRLDPPVASISELGQLSEDDDRIWHEQVDYDKVGGTPNFFQGLEFPDFEGKSVGRDRTTAIPIFMIRSADAAALSLGDAGRGVGFLSPDQRSGAYLWFN